MSHFASRHQACDCGFGWYGSDDSSCLWCEMRSRFPHIPRPVDEGIDARSPDSNVHPEQGTKKAGTTGVPTF